MRKIIYILLIILSIFEINADGSTSNLIYIGNFLPYKSKDEPANRELILEKLKSELAAKGFEVRTLSGNNADNLKTAKDNNAKFYLSGYYSRKSNGNILIYGHVYNPDRGNIIDALNLSDSLGDMSEIELPPEEIKIEDSVVADRFAKKFSQKVRFNTNRKENAENVDEFVNATSIGKDLALPVVATDTKSSDDVFKLLQETEVVTASRTKESIIDVPATTMVVTEQDFKNRGYTSLEDIFRDLPGFDYIGQQGTDNAVLYQRGYRTPFTSRTLLMINGVVENDLWAQVATPGRMYPISNIKRVEVIYGPASAVYGPNAFQGIINIITKDGKENNGKTSGKASFMYGSGPSWAVDGGVTSQIGDMSIAMSARKHEGNDANKNASNYGYNTQYWINNPAIWGPLLTYGSGGKPFGKYSDPVNDWGTILSVGYKTLKIGANITNKYEAYGSQYPGDKAQPTSMWGKSGTNIYAENQVDITSKLSSYSLAVYRDSRIYGDWAEADGYGYGPKSYTSYISFTRWNEISKSVLVNQNIEYKINDKVKLMAGLKAEFKKLTKSYDIPGYWWGSSYVSSIDFLNPNVNKGVEDHFPNGYAIGLSTDPLILKGPSPRTNKMPEENTIGTFDRGGFLLSIIDWGKFRFSPGVRYDENSIYGRALNPRITGIYKFTDASAFKLLYGEAFNEPSPLNLFGGYSGRTADLKLRPEKAKTTEAIFMHQGKQALNEFSVYYSRYEDVIKESAQNAGRRRIYGVEYKFRLNTQNFIEKSAPISLYVYYTYTKAQADTYYDHNMRKWQEGTTPLGQYEYLVPEDAKFIPRKREYTNLGDIAAHKLNFGINLPIKELFILNLRGNYTGRREYYSRNALSDNGPLKSYEDIDAVSRRIVQQQDKTLDPHLIFDTGITINFKEYGYFTLKVMNVLNTTYFHPGTGQGNAGNYYYARSLGYDSSILPQPGRSFMVNLTLTF